MKQNQNLTYESGVRSFGKKELTTMQNNRSRNEKMAIVESLFGSVPADLTVNEASDERLRII